MVGVLGVTSFPNNIVDFLVCVLDLVESIH